MGVNSLELFIDDITSVLASFDVYRIRKATTEDGPWTEITAEEATAATLLGTVHSSFAVSGLTFSFQIDSEEEDTVTFTGTNPLTASQVVAQINAVHASIASSDYNHIRLTSTLTGTQSRVEITGGSALTLLGFTEDQLNVGLEEYGTLVSGQHSYNFYDRDGGDYVYEAAFYSTTTHLLSQWSLPFTASPGTAIGAEHLSLGSIDLVDASGVSVPDQIISFFPVWNPLTVDNHVVALIREPVSVTTNNAGHAEVSLVRGLTVKVVFQGTSLIREITVPDSATFNLLSLISSAPDPYNPVEPDYPSAIRRS